MRKKCSLAMALLHNPRVLFLDEPFEGIDPVSSRNIKDLLLMMAGKGVTVFLTSHILEVVERLVQSFAIIVSGEIVCTQTVAETLSAGDTLESCSSDTWSDTKPRTWSGSDITIIRYQGRAFWRRLSRGGKASAGNQGIVLIIFGLGFIRYLMFLRTAALNLSVGKTGLLEKLLLAIFVAWLFH